MGYKEIQGKGMRKRVLAFVPMGPPYAGPEVSNSLLLKECPYELKVINTSYQKSNADKGKLSLRGVYVWLSMLLKLILELIKFRADYFYYNLSATSLGALKDFIVISIARPFVGIIVAHMRGGHFRIFYDSANLLIKLLVRWYLVKCDRIIVQSEGLKSQFKGLVPDSRLIVVPNPAPDEMFSITPNISGENILFVGHLSKAKGWIDLLKVLPDIFREFPECKVIAVGSKIKDETNIKWVKNEDPDEVFNEYINQNGFTDRFEFYENIIGDKKIEVFKKASIFVLPSYSEGFSMAVLEAMALGLPIITTNVGALPEILHSENFIINPGDEESLREALRFLLKDPALRHRLSRINKQNAKRFSEERVREEFWKVFSK